MKFRGRRLHPMTLATKRRHFAPAQLVRRGFGRSPAHEARPTYE